MLFSVFGSVRLGSSVVAVDFFLFVSNFADLISGFLEVGVDLAVVCLCFSFDTGIGIVRVSFGF